MRILIFGLPGSGKSTFAIFLRKILTEHAHKYNHPYCNRPEWLNADQIRKEHNDWDFSVEGRVRQAQRLHDLSKYEKKVWIVDFVCPTLETREIFKPDLTVWMNTIEKGRYEDTNKIFVQPDSEFVDYTLTDFTVESHYNLAREIEERIYGND